MFEGEETTGAGPTGEGTTSTTEGSSEAFGGDGGFQEFAAAMNSEPTAEKTETTEAEPVLTEDVDETAPTTEKTEDPAAEEKTTEEDDSEWLPDEQDKEFSLDVLAKYAKRYGYTEEEVKADPRLQRSLKDKINSDILIRQAAESETELEPTQDGKEKTDAEKTDATDTTQDPAKQREQYYTQLTDLVTNHVDKEAVAAFGSTLLEAFGVTEAALKNPDLPDEDKAAMKALFDNKGAVGQKMAIAATDLMRTVLPHFLGDAIEMLYPGTQSDYQTRVVSSAWDSIRNEKDDAGNPLYKDLPAYGEPAGPFGQLIRKAETGLGLGEGGLAGLVIRDNKGQPLSPRDQIAAKYRMVAKFSAGQRVSPAEAVKLIDKGKQQATDATRRRQQGRVMGAGKPTQQFEAGKGDAVMDNLGAFIDAEEASSKPFGK